MFVNPIYNARMLEIKNLMCQRGNRILFEGLHFMLKAGELLNVQGANGSGKSSLLRQLCGLLPIREGQVLWQQQAIDSISESYQNQLLYIGHRDALKLDLTPLENLVFYSDISQQELSKQAIAQQLTNLGLGQCLHLPAMQLSQGQKKRIALARLWLCQRKLWILDEPYAALDQNAMDILNVKINRHLTTGGMVVLTSHQPVDIDVQQQSIRLAA